MILSGLVDLLVLFALGIIGWQMFRLLRLPNPPMLGSVLFVGILRAVGVDLPVSPGLFSPITQMCLGLFIGSMITRDTLRQIKTIFPLAILIMAWVVSFALGAGAILTKVTSMDYLTAVLSASTGGLPEMTVLAVETDANAPVVVFIQVFRVLTVMVAIPLIAHFFLRGKRTSQGQCEVPVDIRNKKIPINMGNLLFSCAIALAGGYLFHSLGLPAGAMLGSMLFMIVVTLSGYGVRLPTHPSLDLVQVGVGIMAADKITPEVVTAITSGDLVSIFLKSTLLTFASSALLAYIVHRVSRWDWLSCLLAAAPAGMSAIAVLALEYERDPVPISILHVCRVMILKTVIPLVVILFLQ